MDLQRHDSLGTLSITTCLSIFILYISMIVNSLSHFPRGVCLQACANSKLRDAPNWLLLGRSGDCSNFILWKSWGLVMTLKTWSPSQRLNWMFQANNNKLYGFSPPQISQILIYSQLPSSTVPVRIESTQLSFCSLELWLPFT